MSDGARRRLTTLALADDETVVRQALRCYLEQHRDFRIVGESADGLGVAPLVRKVRPDVLIRPSHCPECSDWTSREQSGANRRARG